MLTHPRQLTNVSRKAIRNRRFVISMQFALLPSPELIRKAHRSSPIVYTGPKDPEFYISRFKPGTKSDTANLRDRSNCSHLGCKFGREISLRLKMLEPVPVRLLNSVEQLRMDFHAILNVLFSEGNKPRRDYTKRRPGLGLLGVIFPFGHDATPSLSRTRAT
jgi:hypothetical protein